MQLTRLTALALLTCAFSSTALPAQDADLNQLEKQLVQIFERPSGTPISSQQKVALGEFVEANAGNLGRLAYANGLHSYLTRNPAKATSELDAFFKKHESIANEEHRLMAGRIYMTAFMRLAATKDPARESLCRYAERTTRLYANLELLARYMPRGLTNLEDEKTSAAVRIALVRGALASAAPATALDNFVSAIYAGTSSTSGTGGTRRSSRRKPGTARPRQPADIKRDAMTGAAAPALPANLVLNGEFTSLAALKGKVVLVDFWATWCGPCRSVIPNLVALQKKHGDDVQVIGATRFYGYGSDFSAPNAKPPHGGAKTVRNLDRDGEIAINKTFAKVFDLNYPIAFIGKNSFTEYGVRGIPTIFVIGRDGKVIGNVVGSGGHDKLEKLLTKALAKR